MTCPAMCPSTGSRCADQVSPMCSLKTTYSASALLPASGIAMSGSRSLTFTGKSAAMAVSAGVIVARSALSPSRGHIAKLTRKRFASSGKDTGGLRYRSRSGERRSFRASSMSRSSGSRISSCSRVAGVRCAGSQKSAWTGRRRSCASCLLTMITSVVLAKNRAVSACGCCCALCVIRWLAC